MSGTSTIATRTPQRALLAGLPARRWAVDRDASTVAFSIRHLAVATVRGHFDRFEGWVETGGSTGGGRVGGRVEVASIDTGVPARDEHLRAASCFDADRHPWMELDGELVAIVPAVELVGDLTILGCTQPLTLTGAIPDLASDRIRLALCGTVRRRAFGLEWGALFDRGIPIVGDAVSIQLDLLLRRSP